MGEGAKYQVGTKRLGVKRHGCETTREEMVLGRNDLDSFRVTRASGGELFHVEPTVAIVLACCRRIHAPMYLIPDSTVGAFMCRKIQVSSFAWFGLWSSRSLIISTLVNSHLFHWSIRTMVISHVYRTQVNSTLGVFRTFSCKKHKDWNCYGG